MFILMFVIKRVALLTIISRTAEKIVDHSFCVIQVKSYQIYDLMFDKLSKVKRDKVKD